MVFSLSLPPSIERPFERVRERNRASAGRISTAVYSPNFGHWIGLGFLSGGLDRKGQTVYAAYPLRGEAVPVEVVDPVFFDPEGERSHA